MKTISIFYRSLGAVLLAALANQASAAVKTRPAPASPAKRTGPARVSSDYGKLPLAFEPNLGQTDARVRFLARGRGMITFFTDTETAMVLSRNRQPKTLAGPGRRKAPAGEVEQAVVRMKLQGAGQPRQVIGVENLPGVSNYFIGNDPKKWSTDVPRYGRIRYAGVYPGIDVVWYGNQRRLEYDFVIGPGADPKQIQVAYEGVESLRVEENGDLVLRTALGEMRQQKPTVYQEVGGQHVEVGAHYSVVATTCASNWPVTTGNLNCASTQWCWSTPPIWGETASTRPRGSRWTGRARPTSQGCPNQRTSPLSRRTRRQTTPQATQAITLS
jgi:hypothetical protein